MALDLCSHESERIFAQAQRLHDLCHWSCAVVIAPNEAKKFSQVDPNIAGLLSVNDLHVSPISIILYIAIKYCQIKAHELTFTNILSGCSSGFLQRSLIMKKSFTGAT